MTTTSDLRSVVQQALPDAHETPADALALGRLLAQRHSCRAYRPDPVPRAVIARMLSLAQLSPSWCNSQPWQVVVTEGDATERLRAALYAHARQDLATHQNAPQLQPDFPFPAAYRGVYKERQREVGWQLYESVGIAHGDRVASAEQALQNFRLFDAPHMLLITSERELGTYGAVDCGVYLGSLLLAAQSLGLACIPQAALASYAPLMRAQLGIAEHRAIVAGVSFGYAAPDHPANRFRSRRATVDEAVEWMSA